MQAFAVNQYLPMEARREAAPFFEPSTRALPWEYERAAIPCVNRRCEFAGLQATGRHRKSRMVDRETAKRRAAPSTRARPWEYEGAYPCENRRRMLTGMQATGRHHNARMVVDQERAKRARSVADATSATTSRPEKVDSLRQCPDPRCVLCERLAPIRSCITKFVAEYSTLASELHTGNWAGVAHRKRKADAAGTPCPVADWGSMLSESVSNSGPQGRRQEPNAIRPAKGDQKVTPAARAGDGEELDLTLRLGCY